MSRSNDVFRHLTEEETQALVGEMRDGMRPLYKELEKVAAATLKLRPVFLGKQPFPKRCEMIRKAMSLKVNAEQAGDILAAFFMEKHQADVIELLDALGVEHEEGALKDNAPKPPAKKKLATVKAHEIPRYPMNVGDICCMARRNRPAPPAHAL